MISNDTCVIGTSSDVNCRTYQGAICSVCFTNFFVSTDGRCKQVSPLCKNFSQTTGGCTSCYQGYELSGDNCVEFFSKDKNCKRFDTTNQNYCLECYAGFLIIGGKCLNQNPLCKTIDMNTGACLSCWQGYVISGQNCIIDQQVGGGSIISSDPYCIKYINGLCAQCSSGYYFSRNDNICKQLDPLCKTSDMTNGNCQSCYPGYSLSTFLRCEILQVVQIVNCNTINDVGVCIDCLSGYYLTNNACQPVSILCATYNRLTGQCLTCVDRHYLENGACYYPGIYD